MRRLRSLILMCSFLAAGCLSAAVFAQIGNSTSPPTTNPQQPGLGSGPSSSAASQAQSGTSQLGTQSGNSTTTPRTNAETNFQPGEVNDALLAACLIVDNEGEIAVSDIGRQRAENPEVKKFAEQMVTDHTQMLAKLRHVPGAAASVPASNGSPSDGSRSDIAPADRNATNTTVVTTSTPAAANPGTTSAPANSTGSSFAHLKRELGEQCLQSKRQELEGKQGAEFDKCFMGMQLAMHMEALDTLRVFQRHAQGDLRQIIDEAIPKVTAHLEHAKMTKQSLEGAAAVQTSAIRK